MHVQFTPAQEAQLARLAAKTGISAAQLVTSVVMRYLDDEARFRAAVEKGITEAERGEFIEEVEMDARFEQMLRS